MDKFSYFDNCTRPLFFDFLGACARLPPVREEVIKNYDDNLWWPQGIIDWRLRMVIAGWGNRISYNTISNYRKVIDKIIILGYDRLCELSQKELFELLSPLGLTNSRYLYLKSINDFVNFIEKEVIDPTSIPNDEFVQLIVNRVKGAGYKVAQCAVLYTKGYHCGIFPVDSGMKDMLGPCLGLSLPSGPIGHEVMRKQIEKIISDYSQDFFDLAVSTGYSSLAIPRDKPPIWWVHLVLIYFKRLYCNRKDPQKCPLRSNPSIGEYIGEMCDRKFPRAGRLALYPYKVDNEPQL